MKAPDFWWRPPGIESLLLGPVAAIYGAVAAARMQRPGTRASVPVVCVGNVTVGGSGKTPTAVAVAELLRRMGLQPAFLTRGYGGSLAGPVAVDADRHGAPDVGDEALLLARHGPTIVSHDRPAGAALAVTLGATAIVMDDGLQNPSLAKNLTLAVFDGARGVGTGRPLPAGPLRAPFAAQWPLIDAVVIMGPGAEGDRIAAEAAARAVPVVRARLRPDPADVVRLHGRRLLAFAGIGDPDKFYRTCRDTGLTVAATRSFPDHHAFTAAELAQLLDEAERNGLVPVTTEKDRVRLAVHAASEPRLDRVETLAVSAVISDETGFRRLLANGLGVADQSSLRDGRGRPSRFRTASGDE